MYNVYILVVVKGEESVETNAFSQDFFWKMVDVAESPTIPPAAQKKKLK